MTAKSAARPMNILMIMADQWTAWAAGAYGHPVVKTPNFDALAENAAIFDSFYCNSPLCAPARFTLMAGRQASAIGAYDNASEFTSAVPTMAHYLRSMGYQTCLSGKMHFIGADQLHGFEQRLTTDIYPADFGWTVNWDEPEERIDWWYHNMLSVKQAGVAEITNQLEFDDEVGSESIAKLYDLARGKDDRPFFLCTSFTHPHDPYACRGKYWDMYDPDEIDLPRDADEAQDPHSQRILKAVDMPRFDLSEEDIRNARRAYYGNITYVDEWIGRLLKTLDDTGLRDNTIVIVTSDHGDMLGEKGLWYKMSYFEGAARIPLVISAPGLVAPQRVANNCSHVDILPTLVDLAATTAGQPAPDPVTELDGRSLLPLITGEGRDDPDEAIGEYMGEGSISPLFMIRRGRFKYVWTRTDPAQLYDLEADPMERENLYDDPAHAETAAAFDAERAKRWDADGLHEEVLADQRRRRFVWEALGAGEHTAWDFQPGRDASKRYMRNHLDLNELERWSRYPSPKEFD